MGVHLNTQNVTIRKFVFEAVSNIVTFAKPLNHISDSLATLHDVNPHVHEIFKLSAT